jgi:hypothetical protein
MKNKKSVLRKIKGAHCVRLNDGTGYVVWAGKIQPRGFEQPAIGFGLTARQAWASVEFQIC